MEKKKLNRTIQCGNCPWKVSSEPSRIQGYVPELHKQLFSTIASEAPEQQITQKQLRVMACHHSKEDAPEHCIGWLNNQLGVGNNIKLRILMLDYENAHQIEVFGEQYENFEQTINK